MKKTTSFTFYFLLFAGYASILPFMVLYYQQLGFSGVQISLLAGLPPLVSLFSSPFWANVADATGRHKLVMSIAMTMVIVTTAAFPFLKTFALVLCDILLLNVFVAPITSFADSATMSMLADEKEMYGRVRLGGTIGWGLAAPVAGALIKTYGLSLAFWMCAALLLLALFISQRFSFSQRHATETQGSLRDLLSNRHWLLFLALAMVGGTATSSASAYFSPYMKELGGDEFHVGIALTVATLSEVPVFFFSNHLLKKLKSYGLFNVAVIVTALRSLVLAASSAPLFAILAQLSHGLTYPAMWIAGVSYADEHAPHGLKSTAQGLFGAMMYGIGSALGGFTGGIMLEQIGGRGLLLVSGSGTLVAVAAIMLIERRLRKYETL